MDPVTTYTQQVTVVTCVAKKHKWHYPVLQDKNNFKMSKQRVHWLQFIKHTSSQQHGNRQNSWVLYSHRITYIPWVASCRGVSIHDYYITQTRNMIHCT